jgi:hypothetical protein
LHHLQRSSKLNATSSLLKEVAAMPSDTRPHVAADALTAVSAEGASLASQYDADGAGMAAT